MCQINQANLYGPLSPEKLFEFETEFDINLPAEYRDFLLRHNGGDPSLSFFWIAADLDGSEVLHFFGIHHGPIHLSIDTYLRRERYFPKSMLPIGNDGVGNYICIGISAANFGEVFFLDHDSHSFDDPDSLAAFTKLADTFPGFLSALMETPD